MNVMIAIKLVRTDDDEANLNVADLRRAARALRKVSYEDDWAFACSIAAAIDGQLNVIEDTVYDPEIVDRQRKCLEYYIQSSKTTAESIRDYRKAIDEAPEDFQERMAIYVEDDIIEWEKDAQALQMLLDSL